MKKILPILLTASLVVACQEQQPTAVPGDVSILFDISDGASGGPIAEFFFLPPLADHPSGNTAFDEGELNHFLNPLARVCELEYPLPDPLTARDCVRDIVTLPLDLDATNEQYKVNWKTGDFDLNDGYGYRIHVFVGSEEFGLLGYRDVIPLANPSTASCTSAPDSDCQINNGSNVPIKVWIGENAFCPVDEEGNPLPCQTQSFDLVNGVSFNLEDQFLLNVPNQPASQQGTVTFQKCVVDNTEALIDIPLFGDCMETVLFGEPIELDEDFTATISFCDVDLAQDYGEGTPDNLSTAQLSNLRVLHFRGPDGKDGAEVLRVANDCPQDVVNIRSNPIERFASRILSWITPRPLQAALVAGKGGFGGNSLDGLGSKFIIGLPAKIDFVDVADATRVAATGSTLPTQAKVTDLNGDPVAGATVRWNVDRDGSEDAEVWLNALVQPTSSSCAPGSATGDPDEVVCVTDEYGTVEVDWTLSTDPGVNKLTAGGRGIADDREGEACSDIDGAPISCNGPRNGDYDAGPFDPFQPIGYLESMVDDIVSAEDEISTTIAEDTRLLFTAIGCEPGFGTPNSINGVMDDGEWDCAIEETFPVNLSGGSTVEATLYYMNDPDNFYLAVVVPGTGRVNGLRVEWDDNPPDGVTEGDHYQAARNIGDDVWEYDPEDDAKADKFIDDKCSTSSQSSCGNNDADFITAPDVGMDTEAAFNNLGDQTVYEMSHPLSTGQVCQVFGRKGCSSDFSIDLQAAKGQTKGAFITLRLGRGAQGNTQWPGFLEYRTIEIK